MGLDKYNTSEREKPAPGEKACSEADPLKKQMNREIQLGASVI
jgi:hypothetical protein